MSGMLIDPVPGKTSGSAAVTLIGDVIGVGSGTIATTLAINQLDNIQAKIFAKHYATSALPSNVYANGTAGVGATLTATANGFLTINGVLVATGDNVIVAGEVTDARNGLYIVSAPGVPGIAKYVLTRSVQMNSPPQFLNALIFYPGPGGTPPGFLIRCTSAVVTVGATSVTFTDFRMNAAAVTATGSPGANTLLHGDYSWGSVANADLVAGATNTVKGNIGAGTVDVTASQLNTMTGNSGDVSIAAFGSTPTANGASLTGQAIALQPADGTHPGAIALAAQTMGSGDKTFSGKVIPTFLKSNGNQSFPGAASAGISYWYTDATLGNVMYGFGTAADVTIANRSGSAAMQVIANTTNVQFGGNIDLALAGAGIAVKEGTNCKQGTATLVAGTVTVANTSVTANSRIFLSGGALNASTAIGIPTVSTITAGTSFVIRSMTAGAVTTQAGDLRTIFYEIFEPG